MYCTTNQFPELQFLVPHKKTHGVHVLVKNDHMHFDPKLGHVTCEMHRIPCACNMCNSIIDQPWIPGIPEHQQPSYQSVKDFTYWTVLGSLTTGTL